MVAVSPPLEAFAEALSVPPLLHVCPVRPIKVLTFGQFALPLAKLALRYPNTVEVQVVNADTGIKDRRLTVLRRLEDLPPEFRADVVAVAVPGDPSALLRALQPHLTPTAVVVVGLDQFSRGPTVKSAMQQIWKQVLPYREHAPQPVLFLLASNQRFGTTLRPFPPNLQRLNPRYLQSLFSLAKDEYDLLYGPSPVEGSFPPQATW